MWPYIRDVLELSMFAVIVWLDWRLLRVEENNQNALRQYLEMRNKWYGNRAKNLQKVRQSGPAEAASMSSVLEPTAKSMEQESTVPTELSTPSTETAA